MSEQPPHDPGTGGPQDGPEQPEDLGTVAEEAAKLFGALSDWAKDQGGEWAHGVSGLADHATATARRVHEHLGDNIANGSPECRYCPVCRAIHVVREMSPEVRGHLTTAATSLLQAAAGLLATQAATSAQRPGVERIDLDEDDRSGWDETDQRPDPTRDPGQKHEGDA